MKRGIPILLLGIGGIALWSDTDTDTERLPPPAVDTEPDIAPDEVAGAALAEVVGTVLAIKDADPDSGYRLIAALEGEGPPGEQALDAWRAYAHALAQLDVVLARPGLSLVDDSGLGKRHLLPLPTLARALCVRAWAAAVVGEPARAIEDFARAFALTDRVGAAGRDMLPVAVALEARRQVVEEMAELLTWSADDAVYREALALLLRHPPRFVDDARRTASGECAALELEALERFASASQVAAAVELGGVHAALGLSADVVDPVIAAVLYDPDEMVRFHRAGCASVASRISQPPHLRERVTSRAPERRALSLADYFDNPAGRLVAEEAGPWVLHVVERAELTDAAQSVLTVLVAARLHLVETGRPPARPEALVPRWLESLPDDPFADLPIRVDGERVWSAGDALPFERKPRLSYPIVVASR